MGATKSKPSPHDAQVEALEKELKAAQIADAVQEQQLELLDAELQLNARLAALDDEDDMEDGLEAGEEEELREAGAGAAQQAQRRRQPGGSAVCAAAPEEDDDVEIEAEELAELEAELDALHALEEQQHAHAEPGAAAGQGDLAAKGEAA